MYTDVTLSKTLSESFKKERSKDKTQDYEFSIIVGTQMSWPFLPIKGYTLSGEVSEATNGYT